MSHCFDTLTCPTGDCIGCKDGQLWCQDPRCAPNCPECAFVTTDDFNGNIVIIIILFTLITILFIIWFVYGPQLFEGHSDHIRANVVVPTS